MKSKKEQLTTNVKLDSAISITKEDLIAIKVSDYETKLNSTKATLMTRIKKVKSVNKIKHNELETSTKLFAESKSNSKVEEAITALKKLYGSKTNVISSCDVVNVSYEDKKITFKANVITSDAKKHFGTGKLEFNFNIPLSKSILSINKSIKDNDSIINQLNDDLYEVNKALSNIDVVERQAKAALARKVLNSSREGASFLDSIDDIHGIDGVKLLKD